MSALEPGLYSDAEGHHGILDADGDFSYLNPSGYHCTWRKTDLRPLIVLDLEDPAETVRHMRAESAPWDCIEQIARQIEAQTKPARIPEPGLWGVVEASFTSQRIQQPFLRDNLKANVGGGWVSIYGPPETDKRRVEWDDLIDPTLIREGLS